ADRIAHERAAPPAVLFHGTATSALDAILASGLRPMRRQYVHLTGDSVLAMRVGARHGRACLLRVDAARAAAALSRVGRRLDRQLAPGAAELAPRASSMRRPEPPRLVRVGREGQVPR